MFTSFNSIPVYKAYSLEEQGRMRQLLEAADIEHSVSAVDTNAPRGFYPVISPALMQTQSIEYIFYVHKKDKERAEDVLEREWHWEEG